MTFQKHARAILSIEASIDIAPRAALDTSPEASIAAL
jgi:hypothetical protein